MIKVEVDLILLDMTVRVEADVILLEVDVVLILLHQLIKGEDVVVVVPLVTEDVEENTGVDLDMDVTIGRNGVGVRVGVEWS